MGGDQTDPLKVAEERMLTGRSNTTFVQKNAYLTSLTASSWLEPNPVQIH